MKTGRLHTRTLTDRTAGTILSLALLAGTLLSTPRLSAGQEVEDLAGLCAAFTPGACFEAAVAARALQGHAGLLAGLGAEVPGSATTLGRRLGATPRVAVSLRAAFAPVSVPDLSDAGPTPSREASAVVPALHGGIALGVFDGFRLIPTVGGILSLDLLGSTSVSFFPSGEGFGGRVGALSLGVRVGVLRESFDLPGISVSVTRRFVGTATLGDLAAGDASSVEVDPSVTSLRATVGKDLLSVGLIAGAGWDRYGGDARVRVAGSLPDGVADGLVSSRALFFGGASLNFLVLQLSAEAGWARGFGGVAGYAGAPFDPTGGTAWGSFAFRLTI